MNCECTPFPQLGCDRNFTAVQKGQVLDYGQAQPSATQISGAGSIYTVEAFEESLQMLGRNSFTSVLDQNVVARAAVRSDRYLALFSIKLDAILDEICQHLFEPSGIGMNH
jgi:hypothetical protein